MEVVANNEYLLDDENIILKSCAMCHMTFWRKGWKEKFCPKCGESELKVAVYFARLRATGGEIL